MDEDLNQDELELGDRLAVAGDRVALEYGWWAGTWIHGESQRAGEPGGKKIGKTREKYPDSRADPNSRAAFTYALTVLEKRHGRYLSRSQITDRIRIGRAFPAQVYDDLVEELHYNFTFSQLRAAFVRDDEKRTMELLLWASENDADPMQINARKMDTEVESDEQKAWRCLVERAEKYVFRGAGSNQGRHRLARAILEWDQRERATIGTKKEQSV